MSWTSGVTKHVLPNGLTVLAHRDDSAPVVAVVAHVRAGYFDEPDEWVGISHVLEHMFFKGAGGRGPGEAAREIQSLGGYLNASTIYDKTVYYTVLPASDGALDHAVRLQADGLINPALGADELTRELEVIVQEAKRKLDNPSAVAGETLYELLFQVHRMRRWRIGTEEGLRRLCAADVRSYHESRYSPERTILALVGDLSVSSAIALAERVYGKWTGPRAPVPGCPPEPAGAKPAVRVLSGDVQAPLAVLGWRTDGPLHPDAPALDAAAAVLGAGRGSWLYRGLRRPGLASGVRAFHYAPTEVGVFEILLEGEASRLDEAVTEAIALTRGLETHVADALDLERVRSLLAVRWARRFETMEGRAASLCVYEALGDFRLADELYDRSMGVSADDVRNAASRYLDPEASSAVFYLPPETETRFSTPLWPPVRSGTVPACSSPDRRGHQRARSVISGLTTAQHGRAYHVALAGADLIVREKRGSGLASVGVYIPSFRDRESSETAGLAALMARAALRGAAGFSGDGLAAAAERLGGPITPSVGLDAVGWEMTVPSDSLVGAAELLLGVALEPDVAAREVALERALQAEDARRERDDMFRHPVRAVLGAAFPNDPMGLPPLGDPDSVRAIDDDAVRAATEDIGRSRAVIVAVGDASPERLLEALAPFERWPSVRAGAAGIHDAPTWSAGRISERREKAQTALAMAFLAPPYRSRDRFALEVLGGLLGGLAGRLFRALRDERSLAYTVTAIPWLQRRSGAFLTYIATSPARESEARDAMLHELAVVARDPVGMAELTRSRNYAAGGVELRQQSTGSVAADTLHAWIHGVLDDLDGFADDLRAVTAADLNRVAAEVFHPEARAEFVARGSGVSR